MCEQKGPYGSAFAFSTVVNSNFLTRCGLNGRNNCHVRLYVLTITSRWANSSAQLASRCVAAWRRRRSKISYTTTTTLNHRDAGRRSRLMFYDTVFYAPLAWSCYSDYLYISRPISSVLLAVLDPRVGHTMDVLSPFIPVICHSDWLFHRESCPRLDVVHPGRAWPSSPSCTWHCSLHYLFLQARPISSSWV